MREETRNRVLKYLLPTRKVLLHPLIYIHAFVAVAYFAATLALSPDQVIQILNYMLVSIAAAALIVYVPASWFSHDIGLRRAALLSSGICLIALTAVEFRGWSIAVRITGWMWMQHSYWLGFFLAQAIAGYVLHLTPPDAIEQGVPGKSWIRIGVAIGIGMMAAMLLIGLGLDKELQ